MKRTITGGGWREGYRPAAGVTIESAVKAYRDLYRAGDVTTTSVKEYARPADSLIHGICDWEDAAAAEAFRDIQVRRFLRGFQPIFKEVGEPEPLIHVPPALAEKEGVYIPCFELSAKPDQFARALGEARSYATAGAQRVKELQALISGDDIRLQPIKMADEGFAIVREALGLLVS